MSHPDADALAAIAVGDVAGLDEAELAHVRACAQCSATVASIERTAVLARAGAPNGPLTPPPPDLWARIEAALDAPEAQHVGGLTTAGSDPRPDAPASVPGSAEPSARPPLRAVPTAGTQPRPFRRSLTPAWAAGLAAAGIAIGLLTGRALWQDPAPVATTIATAELDTLDTQERLGDATLVRGEAGMDLRVATAPLDPGEGYLEVWLINTDGKRMVSIGVLRGDGPETFPISQTLIDQGYVVVDISREGFDDRPEHSGDSLARGKLPT